MCNLFWRRAAAVFIGFLVLLFTASSRASNRIDQLSSGKQDLIVVSDRSLGPRTIGYRNQYSRLSVEIEPLTKAVRDLSYKGGSSRLRVTKQNQILIYYSNHDKVSTEFTFRINSRLRRYDLIGVARHAERWAFDEAGYESASDEAGVVALSHQDSNCADTRSVGLSSQNIEALQGATALQARVGPTATNCNDLQKAQIQESLDTVTRVNDDSVFLGCVSKHEPEIFNQSYSFAVQPLASEKMVCSPTETKSKTNTSEYRIELGSDFFLASPRDRNKVLMHELLHLGPEDTQEFFVDEIVKCCSGGRDAARSCRNHETYKGLMRLYNDTTGDERHKQPLPRVGDLISEIARSNFSESKKRNLVKQMKLDYAAIHSEYLALDRQQKDALGTLEKYTTRAIDRYVATCSSNFGSEICAKLRSNSFEINDFNRAMDIMGSELVLSETMATTEMSENIGKTPAAAASNDGPPVPQNLEVRPPDANRLAKVRDQMEEYSKPYRAVTEQLGTATRSLVANIAPIAPAVASTSNRSFKSSQSSFSASPSRSANSSGSFSATVTSVNGNELKIQLPDGSTASGWIPFSKNQFGTPQIKIEPPSKKVMAATLASSEAGDSSTRVSKGSVPGRIPRETSNTDGASSGQAQTTSGGSISGGSGSSSVARSPSGGRSSRGSLDFSTQKQQEISRIKLQLVRAQDPLQAIQSHLEDLRRNSMLVIYEGKKYPADLEQAEITIDLNRYRGNR